MQDKEVINILQKQLSFSPKTISDLSIFIKEYETTYINKYNNKISKSKILNFIKNSFEKKYSYYA